MKQRNNAIIANHAQQGKSKSNDLRIEVMTMAGHDLEKAYTLLYSKIGLAPNQLINNLERDLCEVERKVTGNDDLTIHWKVWNSVKDMPHVQNAFGEIPYAEEI